MPLTLTASPTDTVGVSATLARRISFSRSFANTVGITSTLVSHVFERPGFSDAVGITNTLAVHGVFVQFDNWRPVPSPDNTRMLSCRTPVGEHDSPTGLTHLSLWVYNFSGQGDEVAFNMPGTWTSYGHPEWSSDGTAVVVWAELASTYELMLIDVTQFGLQSPAAPTSILSVAKPNVVGDPSFSPDGNTIIYTHLSGATYSIRSLTDWTTTPVDATLFSGPYPLSDPMFSVDGFFILFGEQTVVPGMTYTYGRSRIKYMNASGDITTILDDGNANLHPVWVTPFQIAFQRWNYGSGATPVPSTAFMITLSDLTGVLMDLGTGEYPRTAEL